jgi:rod shape determining protein RodA
MAAPEGSMEARWDFASRQLRWYGVGFLAGTVALLVPYRRVLDRAYLLYALGLLLLLLVFVIGVSVKGARRWIDLGPARLQPSELMKVATVVVLARYIRFRDDQRTLRGLAIPFLLAGVPMFLILREPDLGTALLFVPLLFSVLYASGARPKHLALVVAMGVVSSPVVYFFGLRDYQRQRVEAFLFREELTEVQKRQEGWQGEQARLAVASGGVFGHGFAEGPQNQTGAVPEHQTDFIFTVLAEEWGLPGLALLVGLFWMLFLFLADLARKCRDPAGKILVTGVLVLLAVQAYVNLAMTVGLGPITGVPLPLVSYGGSSILTTFVALGLALNVGARPGMDFGAEDFR